ncbi:hypothetical protein [Inquilinus sp. Marseille-Q2685]|uniref:hypothetical protein n=1 Tax=Inquilinus sp. Marseille-Q2685 TaxID=2866581 RepID=UPI001CE40AA2|nr:hypothetical protein [Inquilinus sp. Marseille-Q2685]
MPKPHKEAQARKFLALIKATHGKTNEAGTDIRCCFAGGAYKAGKPDETSVIIVRPVGLESLEMTLKKMAYDNKKSGKKFKSSDPVRCEVVGWLRYDGSNIRVDLKEGSDSKAKKRISEYFDDFGIGHPKVRIDDALTEEQKSGLAAIQEENRNYFNMADDDVDGDEAGSDQQAGAAEQPASIDGDSDTEGSPILTPTASEAGDDDVPEEDLMENVVQSDSEDEEEGDEPLSAELQSGIATASSTIAGHAISLSRQIGGVGQKAELGPLTEKISAWLEEMLAALPPEEREMRLHNFTSRLLLMLAYPENLRNLQYVDDDKPETDEDKPGRETVMVNGIDLDSVSTEDLTQEEVTQSLFNLAKVQAKQRQLPYPMNQASPDRIAGMVASGWPEEEDDTGGKRRAEDVAADKRKAVQRLVAVIQQMFLKDESLIGLLGFKKTETAKGDDLVTSLVESIKEVWEAHRNAAIKQKDEVKRRVNQIVKVEALGGTWRHVDDIFLQIDGEISDQLAAIIGQAGEGRAKAIQAVAETIQTNLGYLDGNNIVDLLDNPPFDIGQGAVGETLRSGLAGVSAGLKRIESSSVAAAA